MGIFSTIGGLLGGPFGVAIGGLGDAVVGASEQKKQVKRQNALEMQKYANLRTAAEAGGFHPLAVLQSGGSVNMQAAPRLLTSLSATNAFDALENEITGEGAKARERQNVRDEIERLERERLKHEVAAATRTRPTIGEYGTLNSGNGGDNDEYTQIKENPEGAAKTEHGAPVTTWEGADIGETIMGMINAKRSDAKAQREWDAKTTRMPARPIDIPRRFWARGRPPSVGKIIPYEGMKWQVISGNRMVQIVDRPKGGPFAG